MKTVKQHRYRPSMELADARLGGYYNIGQAAKSTGLSAKMIRHYESLDLIPKPERTFANYRIYSDRDLHVLRFIKRARGLGFSIKDIGTLVGLWQNNRRSSANVKKLALNHITALDQKILEMESMRNALADLAAHCTGDQRPECPILDDLSDVGVSGSKRNHRLSHVVRGSP